MPPLKEHVDKYAKLRLLCLKTNPECFSSTYEDSLLFTEDVWRSRLNSIDKTTIVVSTKSSSSISNGDPEWVGMVMIASPEALKLLPGFISPSIDGIGDSDLHMVFGMWVHPEHRRRGVGRKLMEAGLAWARRDAKGGPEGEAYSGEGGLGPFEVWLSVKQSNHTARALYEGMGFKEVEDSLGEKGEVWMRRKVDESDT